MKPTGPPSRHLGIMLAILAEGLLFVAAIAAVATLLLWLLLHATPLGTRLRQTRNRRRIERDAELVCPIHGRHEEQQLVRLPTGERICPDCFREAVAGEVD